MKLYSMLRLLALLAVLPVFTSCSMFEEQKKEEEEPKEDRFAFLGTEKEKESKRKNGKEETLQEEQVQPEQQKENKTIRDKMEKVPKTALQPPPEKPREPLHFYDDFIMLNGDEEITVNLVFNSAPLLDVIPSFADALGFNFLADSDLKGVVTLNIDQKMTRKELWNTFDKMLNLAGAGVTVDGTLLRIVALSKVATQSDARLAKDGSGELFYYPLKNTTAKDVIAQLKPFLGKDAVCVELTRPNAVMLADDRANMPKIKQLLEIIDMSGKSAWKRKVVRCVNILPTKLTEELKTVLPVLGFYVMQTTDKTEQPGSIQLTGLDRLQLIVISAATEEAIQEITQWIDLLDSSDSLDQERVFVYKIRNNKAAQLAQALSIIYDTQGASMTIDTSTGNTKTETINSTITNRNRTTTTRTTGSQNNTGTAVEATLTDVNSSVFNTPVRIFADGVLNRLVIRTTPRTYASIKALINKLDVVPAQVLLQVLVVEVTLTESTRFGIEFSMQGGSGSANSLLGTNYENLQPDFNGTGKQPGFSYLLSNPNNPEQKFGYIRALAGNNAVKVVSSPQLLVSSHTEASISVGSQIPILSQGITNSSSSGDIVQNYNQKDVGVILTVTPQITSTDLISLDVTQTLSAAVTNTSSNIDSPEITKREVKTSMTIANGRTMIIGGLIQEKKNDDLQSVPFINQIPILNRLFGSTEAAVERTELLVMITGYIINERSKVEELIERYNDALKSLNEFDATLGGKKNTFESKPRVMTTKEFWSNGLF